MQRFTDQNYLTQNQYKNSGNLDARVAIHKNFSTNPYGWFNWVFDELTKLPANASILELGCGSGELWKECADRIPAGWDITLTDLSDGMLDSARRNLTPLERSFKFEKVDAQSIPYQDRAFDAVIANHMLYHVPNRIKALTEIKRVLKNDGGLIATTVGENHMREMYQWLKRVNLNSRADIFVNPFILENGLEELKTVFSSVEKTQYIDHLEITEAQSIVDYLRSSIGAEDLSENEFAIVQQELITAIKTDGKISITKDSGMFKATK
ncbi:hypothetical protein MASR2M66_18360 [Chloroflexota bacterium]